MSSGDRVMAENYLQHAEHYNRIIAAAQAQMPIQNMQNQRDDSDDDLDDDRDEFESRAMSGRAMPGRAMSARATATRATAMPTSLEPEHSAATEPRRSISAAGPQPVIEGTPAEVALNPEASGDGSAAPASATSTA